MTRRLTIIMLILALSTTMLIGCAPKGEPLVLPSSDKISHIDIDVPNVKDMTITDTHTIESIVYELEANSKVARRESISDAPTNISKYVMLHIVTLDLTEITLYVYRADSKCYVERPYKGVWRITEDTYNYIANILK